MLTLTYEFKLIPSQKQIVIIEDMLAVCRKVWNYALRERKDWINSRKCTINSCSLQQEYIINGLSNTDDSIQVANSVACLRVDFHKMPESLSIVKSDKR